MNSTQVQEQLAAGDPSIQVGIGRFEDELYVGPVGIEEGRAELVTVTLRTAFRI